MGALCKTEGRVLVQVLLCGAVWGAGNGAVLQFGVLVQVLLQVLGGGAGAV